MKKIDIIEVEHGIANNFGDHIEINKHLKEYPDLFESVLQHELSHTNKEFSFKDLKLDLLADNEVDRRNMIKFMFKHPKSFSQLLPLYYSKRNGFVYDTNLIIMYAIMVATCSITIIIGVKYL